MCICSKSCKFLLRIFPGWEVCSVNVEGHSVGSLAIWNPSLADFKAFVIHASILHEGRIKGPRHEVNITNYYGPYVHR